MRWRRGRPSLRTTWGATIHPRHRDGGDATQEPPGRLNPDRDRQSLSLRFPASRYKRKPGGGRRGAHGVEPHALTSHPGSVGGDRLAPPTLRGTSKRRQMWRGFGPDCCSIGLAALDDGNFAIAPLMAVVVFASGASGREARDCRGRAQHHGLGEAGRASDSRSIYASLMRRHQGLGSPLTAVSRSRLTASMRYHPGRAKRNTTPNRPRQPSLSRRPFLTGVPVFGERPKKPWPARVRSMLPCRRDVHILATIRDSFFIPELAAGPVGFELRCAVLRIPSTGHCRQGEGPLEVEGGPDFAPSRRRPRRPSWLSRGGLGPASKGS